MKDSTVKFFQLNNQMVRCTKKQAFVTKEHEAEINDVTVPSNTKITENKPSRKCKGGVKACHP